MKKSLFVIDSNEYIFSFAPSSEEKSRVLLNIIVGNPHLYAIRIPRTIFEEVKRNLTLEAFQEFNKLIVPLTNIDEDIVVPFEIVFKYESKGLKPADAFIAAYTEWTGANALVTENRHFLARQDDLPFKVLTAERCLRFLKLA
jgi:predicted nucleic acid-binding protein